MAFINRSMQPVVWARALREPFIKVSGHKERRARKTQRERGKESEGEREREKLQMCKYIDCSAGGRVCG